jgi:hypothetical protein
MNYVVDTVLLNNKELTKKLMFDVLNIIIKMTERDPSLVSQPRSYFMNGMTGSHNGRRAFT